MLDEWQEVEKKSTRKPPHLQEGFFVKNPSVLENSTEFSNYVVVTKRISFLSYPGPPTSYEPDGVGVDTGIVIVKS